MQKTKLAESAALTAGPAAPISFPHGGFGTDSIHSQTNISPSHASTSEAAGAAGSGTAPLPTKDEGLSFENPQSHNKKKSPALSLRHRELFSVLNAGKTWSFAETSCGNASPSCTPCPFLHVCGYSLCDFGTASSCILIQRGIKTKYQRANR